MYTTLISVQALVGSADACRIVDCRARLGDPQHGPRVYAQGHIPGAHPGHLDDDFAAPPGRGGRHPLPDPEYLRDRFRTWGVHDHDQIVVYDDAGGAFAARAWWCARWLGHAAVAVLDGGLQAWTGPLSKTPSAVNPGSFSIRPPLTRTVDAATLLQSLAHTTLVDARVQARFDGIEEPIDSVAGHIPGATCLPFQDNLDTSGRFKPSAALARRFADLPDDVVCYCGSGVTAAHNILAMKVAGRPEPILYPGSWSEWIHDRERPVEARPVEARPRKP